MVKFGDEICKELCELHEEGLPQTSCADIVGINRKTIKRWLDKGKDAKSGKYRQFYLNWMKAHAKYERYHLNHISNNESWTAHQYLLQVHNPDRYVVVNKTENKNDNTHTLNELFDKELIRKIITDD